MTAMSNRAERENRREQKGVVKTEVPMRVHRAKRKSENYFQYHLLPIVTNIFLKRLLLNLDSIRFLLPSGPDWGELLILPW